MERGAAHGLNGSFYFFAAQPVTRQTEMGILWESASIRAQRNGMQLCARVALHFTTAVSKGDRVSYGFSRQSNAVAI